MGRGISALHGALYRADKPRYCLRWILVFIALAIVWALSGCSTSVPVIPKWPEPPCSLEQPAPLDTLKKGTKLSDMLDVVNLNNGKHKDSNARLSAFISWYIENKKIFKPYQGK